MNSFLTPFILITLVWLIVRIGFILLNKNSSESNISDLLEYRKKRKMIDIVYGLLVLVILAISIINNQNTSRSVPVIQGDDTFLYRPNQESLDLEDRNIQRVPIELTRLERLCSRSRNNLINYDNNYCEQLSELK